jgi:hypothetical protein
VVNAYGETAPEAVTFWFDPQCGWSWLASRWVTEVARYRPIEITWRPLGLAFLRAPSPDTSAGWQRLHQLSKRFVRTAAAVLDHAGDAALGRYYTALGERIHGPDGLFAPVRSAAAEELTAVRTAALEVAGLAVLAALAETGLPDRLVTAMDDDRWDGPLRAAVTRLPGGRYRSKPIGVPAISVEGGAAMFGPVVGELLAGERAVRVWDAFRVLARDDAFFELHRAVERPPLRDHRGVAR